MAIRTIHSRSLIIVNEFHQIENRLALLAPEIFSSFIKYVDKSKTILPVDMKKFTYSMQMHATQVRGYIKFDFEDYEIEKLALKEIGKELASMVNILPFDKIFLLKIKDCSPLPTFHSSVDNMFLRLAYIHKNLLRSLQVDIEKSIMVDMNCFDASLINELYQI